MYRLYVNVVVLDPDPNIYATYGVLFLPFLSSFLSLALLFFFATCTYSIKYINSSSLFLCCTAQLLSHYRL